MAIWEPTKNSHKNSLDALNERKLVDFTDTRPAFIFSADQIAAGVITADIIVAGSITTEKLAAGAVTAEKIAAGTITADKIAAGAITAVKISAGAITTDKLAADAVTADKIAAGAITADDIQAGTITADKIVAKSLTVDQINFVVHTTAPVWRVNTVYATGDKIAPTGAPANGDYWFEATTGGTSGSGAEPTWNIDNADTTSDGTVTWTNRGFAAFIEESVVSGTSSSTTALVTVPDSTETLISTITLTPETNSDIVTVAFFASVGGILSVDFRFRTGVTLAGTAIAAGNLIPGFAGQVSTAVLFPASAAFFGSPPTATSISLWMFQTSGGPASVNSTFSGMVTKK